MSKEDFKNFVKKNPQLIKHVKNNEMTWQKFYEIYDLYGEDASAWKDYLNDKVSKEVTASALGITEFFNWLKTVNLDSVQEGIGNIQRVLGVFQDFTKKDESKPKEEYKPRPIYKHFED
ncbi:MAG: hypothetical protein IJR82_04860 [Bacilli bacterium]|nr:hypothetical protein [Bacilli bacterium]